MLDSMDFEDAFVAKITTQEDPSDFIHDALSMGVATHVLNEEDFEEEYSRALRAYTEYEEQNEYRIVKDVSLILDFSAALFDLKEAKKRLETRTTWDLEEIRLESKAVQKFLHKTKDVDYLIDAYIDEYGPDGFDFDGLDELAGKAWFVEFFDENVEVLAESEKEAILEAAHRQGIPNPVREG